jgi:hypothetical protein
MKYAPYFVFRRRRTIPIRPNPARSMAYSEGSGTADRVGAAVMLMLYIPPYNPSV